MSQAQYSAAEAASQLGVSRPTLLRWFRESRISEVERDWRGWRVFTDIDIERIRRELGQSREVSAVPVNPKLLAYLSKVPAFSKLPVEVLESLAVCARFRGFLRGSRFFSPGDRSTGLHLVVKGRVRVLRLSPEGREQLLADVMPFQTLGEAALFRQSQTHNSIAVCEESSTILTLPHAVVRSLTARYPDLAMAFLGEFANRIGELEQRLEETALHSLDRRMASYLLKVTDSQAERMITESNSTLASRFGVARESVSRTLIRFQERGLIAKQGRSWVILRSEVLESLV